MRKCERERLHEYAYGEVSGAAAGETEDHLRQCEECRRLLQELRQLKACLSAFPEVDPPAQVRTRLSAAAAAACTQVRPLLGEYLDGELDRTRKEALAFHFAFCGKCRRELFAQAQLRGLISALPEATPPLRVRERAREALTGRRAQPAMSGLRLPALLQTLLAKRAHAFAFAGAIASVALALVWLLPVSRQVFSTARVPAVTVPANEGHSSHYAGAPGLQPGEPGNPLGQGTKIAVDSSSSAKADGRGDLAASKGLVAVQPAASRRSIDSKRHRQMEIARFAVPSERETSPAEVARIPALPSAVNPAPTPAEAKTAQPPDLPAEVAEARRELLQASEQYRVLNMESLLTRLPLGGEAPALPRNTPPPPGSGVSVPSSGRWA